MLFDVFLYVGMTARFNKARYVELKQKESEETQPGWSLQNKRHRLKKGGGGDLEKSFFPSVVKNALQISFLRTCSTCFLMYFFV